MKTCLSATDVTPFDLPYPVRGSNNVIMNLLDTVGKTVEIVIPIKNEPLKRSFVNFYHFISKTFFGVLGLRYCM